MLSLLLVIAALVLGIVGAWLGSIRLVGAAVACLAVAALLPQL